MVIRIVYVEIFYISLLIFSHSLNLFINNRTYRTIAKSFLLVPSPLNVQAMIQLIHLGYFLLDPIEKKFNKLYKKMKIAYYCVYT